MPSPAPGGWTAALIADEIRARIKSGELRPGDKLAPMRRMIEEFGVTSQTVQAAIRRLSLAGLVETRQGSGTYVRTSVEMTERSADYTRPLQPGEPLPHKDKTRLTEVGPTGAPEFVADLLDCSPGDVVLARRRTMVRMDVGPVELVTSYYPMDIAQGSALATMRLVKGGSPTELARLGFPPGPATEWVYARMPSPDEARDLNLRATTPVFRLVRQVRTAEGRPIEVIEQVMSGDRYVMRYDL
jgi:GntR family transcriptional regulator